MTILITGAGGYLGSKMTEDFLAQGNKVIALDRFFFGETLSTLRHKNLKIVKDDIRSFPASVFKNVDTCIHLASISNDPASDLNPRITDDINYIGAVRTAQLAKRQGVSKFIFSSSCSVYGHNDEGVIETSPLNPLTVYARSKVNAEREILKLASKRFQPTVLRLATLYGLSRKRMRFDLIVNIMSLHAYKNNKIFIMGGGKHWRPLIHLDDAIFAFSSIALEKNAAKYTGQILNVGSNDQNFQVYQIAYFFKKYFPNVEIEFAPDDPENRSYRVNFDKVKRVMGFETSKTIGDGIEEIKSALELGEITDTIQSNTLKYYQYLLEADRILTAVKLRGKLL